MVQEFQSSGRWALIAVASVATLAMPGMARATQLDAEAVMVQEFQSFCVDYYTPAQCTDAVRFILKTVGSQYFVQLHYDESVDGFLDRLATAVKGGEVLKASETLAIKASLSDRPRAAEPQGYDFGSEATLGTPPYERPADAAAARLLALLGRTGD
jgi:hypothetical protein